ncbi:MAG: (2Fe-2S)-binding protein [Vescimonas sp.]
MRIEKHPILPDVDTTRTVTITVDGRPLQVLEGEMVAAALMANGISNFRYTNRFHKPRSIFCSIGRCTDCMMTIDGVPNIRTCITPVRDGMVVETQEGVGRWSAEEET